MKISKIFHWLYFTVMMLPCVIIPIFAIYTRNENYNSNIEVQVEQNKVIDFNQRIDNKTIDVNNGSIYYLKFQTLDNINIGDILYVRYYQNASITTNVRNTLMFYYDTNTTQKQNESQNRNLNSGYYDWYLTSSHEYNGLGYWAQNHNGSYQLQDIELFNLTQMFGAGNEPTAQEFNNIFTNTYYEYTLSKTETINLGTITYNDTDVGSQFVYTLYNATDKYFNFDNFFGLNNVYSWIQLNWFSGNAPLGFAIFWHFFTYWLLASLAWLLFDVMVYVPLMIHRWMDKGAIE